MGWYHYLCGLHDCYNYSSSYSLWRMHYQLLPFNDITKLKRYFYSSLFATILLPEQSPGYAGICYSAFHFPKISPKMHLTECLECLIPYNSFPPLLPSRSTGPNTVTQSLKASGRSDTGHQSEDLIGLGIALPGMSALSMNISGELSKTRLNLRA